MRRVPRRAASVLVLALASRAASGQTPKDPVPARVSPVEEAAKTKFAAAIRLYNSAQIPGALVLFREVVEETASPNARLYVGLCLEQLGDVVAAYGELSQTAKDATLRAENKYDRTREAALAELSVLEVRVGKIVVTLAETPVGLRVRIGSRAIDEHEIGTPIVLEPGQHRVEATAPGRSPLAREVRLEGGETRTVTLAFADGQLARDAGPARVPILRAAGYAAVGAGVAGFAFFAVTGLMARSKYAALQDACGEARCTQAKYAGEVESGKSLQTVANVGLAMGALLTVTGGALLFWSSKTESSPVAAEPRRGGGYVSYRLDF
jgi:hypothetical protein